MSTTPLSLEWSPKKVELSWLISAGVYKKVKTKVLVDKNTTKQYIQFDSAALSNAIVFWGDVKDRLDFSKHTAVATVNFDMWNTEYKPHYKPTRGYLLDRKAGWQKKYYNDWQRAMDGAIDYAQVHTKKQGAFHVSSRYFRIPNGQDPPRIYIVASGPLAKEVLEDLVTTVPEQTSEEYLPQQVVYSVHEYNKNLEDSDSTFIRISTNPLGLYSTWIEKKDLASFIKLQVGDESWVQRFPTRDEVHAFTLKLHQDEQALVLQQGALVQHRSGIVLDLKDVPKAQASLIPLKKGRKGRKSLGNGRMQTKMIMGESANEWATKDLQWKGKVTANNKPVVKAEWLHRVSNHSLKTLSDRPVNMMFGSRACNTDMIRAETMIDALVASEKIGKFILGTTAKNDGKVQMLDKPDQLNPSGRKTCKIGWYPSNDVTGDEPLESGNVSPAWLTPRLEYKMLVYDTAGHLRWVSTANFYPFSRQCPLAWECALDKRCLEYFIEHFEDITEGPVTGPELKPVDYGSQSDGEGEDEYPLGTYLATIRG